MAFHQISRKIQKKGTLEYSMQELKTFQSVWRKYLLNY